jgi:tetratricopeptide (TPR) repeat protein
LFRDKRIKDAEPILDQAEAGFEQLVAAAPKSVDFHHELGLVQGRKADVLVKTGRLPEAAIVLAKAVEHQDRAVQLSPDRSDTRQQLGDLLLALAEVDLQRGAYKEAADGARRASRAVPDSGHGDACFRAAQILARVVKRVGADPKLVPADRERLTRPYLGRTIVLLRDAIDSDPKLVARIKDDPDIKLLESHPEFKTMMNALVDLRR